MPEPIPPQPIPFEPHRFRGAAAHYLEGRPAYAPALFRRLAALCGLDGRGRVLDLGCGPGQVGMALAPFARDVLAVDPEPEMLRIAAERTAGVFPTIALLQGSSYDIGPAWGRFRLAAVGRAFHWMDRADALRRLDALVEPGGAVALLTDVHPDVPDNRWLAELRALRERFGVGRRSWAPSGQGWVRHEAVLLDSPFSRLETVGIVERRRTAPDRIAQRVLSMSTSSRERLGARADQLAREAEALARAAATDGLVTEVVESAALVAFRPD